MSMLLLLVLWGLSSLIAAGLVIWFSRGPEMPRWPRKVWDLWNGRGPK